MKAQDSEHQPNPLALLQKSYREKLQTDLYWVRCLTRAETVQAVGVSDKTWERLEAAGDIPAKTRLSDNRIGYRVCDIAEWLNRRRENPTD